MNITRRNIEESYKLSSDYVELKRILDNDKCVLVYVNTKHLEQRRLRFKGLTSMVRIELNMYYIKGVVFYDNINNKDITDIDAFKATCKNLNLKYIKPNK